MREFDFIKLIQINSGPHYSQCLCTQMCNSHSGFGLKPVNPSTHLLVVFHDPDEAKGDMLSGEDDNTRCKQPFLPGHEVKDFHSTMDCLRLL